MSYRDDKEGKTKKTRRHYDACTLLKHRNLIQAPWPNQLFGSFECDGYLERSEKKKKRVRPEFFSKKKKERNLQRTTSRLDLIQQISPN